MNHLTHTQVLQLIDQTLDPVEHERLQQHVAECSVCQKELELQRSITKVARQQPLVRTSAAFTKNVMARVLPREKDSVLYRILLYAGNFFALIVVLGILGYALSTTSILRPAERLPEASEFVQSVSSYYKQAEEVFVQKTQEVLQSIAGGAAGDRGDLLLIVVVTIAVLAVFDRFVLQEFIRRRL